MIIGRSPLRITLGGGSTDLPSYYRQFGGFLIAAAIEQYVYTTIQKTSSNEILLRYSQIERVKSVDEIRHPIIREALKLTGITEPNIEIVSLADQPSGTGLGSSGSFTTALLKALYKYKKTIISQEDLAKLACHIELDLLKEPIGKQDQYIAACGGLTVFDFNKDDTVSIKSLNVSDSVIEDLEDNLVMVSTGFYRSASKVLKEQDDKCKSLDAEMIGNLHYVKDLGYRSLEALESGNLSRFGLLMHEHWMHKKKRSASMSNPDIDKWYDMALQNGAIGGKICFTPETLVKTECGFKEIKNIIKNENVYDHQCKLQNVNEVIKRNYNGKILKLKINGLKNPLYVTPEHPLFTTKKDSKGKRSLNNKGQNRCLPNLPIFKQAQLFKKSECLLIPVNTEVVDVEKIKFERKIKQKKYSGYNIYAGIPDETNIDFDFLNTLGWFIAEGSTSRKQFQFSMHKDEAIDANIIANSLKKLFNKTSTIKFNKNSCVLVGSSIVLSLFFNDMCGKLAANKKIPDFIMKLPIKKQTILLRALWSGDGCVRSMYDKRTKKTYTRCSYKTVSLKLAKQVQELCFRLGFICSLKEEKYSTKKLILNNKKESVRQTAYSVCIDGEDALAFKHFMDFDELIEIKRNNIKQLSLQKEFVKIDDVTYAKRSITKIEEIHYKGYVYNLSVNNSHTYTANDIAVHNCGAGSGGFLLLYTEEKQKLKNAIKNAGLHEVPISFDYEGTKIL